MSEYIPRLREELVAAAARERAGERRRRAVRPLRFAPVLAAAAVAAAFVLAVTTIDLADDERPVAELPAGTSLAYRLTPAPGRDAAADAERAAEVLRARLAASGLGGARVTVAGDRLGLDVDKAAVKTVAALAVPGELGIYDWEASVLGPDGRPAPGDEQVTGGPGAGRSAAVSQYEAVQRASKADGTEGPRALWLVDDAARTVLAGPAATRDALAGGSVPEGARVVDVPAGVRVVLAEGVPSAADRWYALGDGAAVSNADIERARATTDPVTGEPAVTFGFTAEGRSDFSALTRTIAERGAATMQPGADPMRGAQHLAIVLDDRIMSVPFIDPREAPNGIDGSEGAHIQGGLDGERARIVAAILNSGPLPASLEPL
jgi:SecD/SecF fusion protein